MPSKKSSRSVPKGTALSTSEPHVVVPFWKGADRGDVPFVDVLPGYRPCPVLSQLKMFVLQEQRKDPSSELGIFLRKLFREESIESLVMLTTLEIIVNDDLGNWKDRHLDEEEFSPFSSEDDEELDSSLLVEGWPLVQEKLSWNTCSALYRRIFHRLHTVTLPHPLTEFAKETLLQMPDKDYEQAVRGASEKKWIPNYTCNRLQASQFLLDYVASLPPRKVGVLLEDPCSTNQPPTAWIKLSQSCVPSAALELSAASTNLQCSLVSLYDSAKKLEGEWTVSTRPPSSRCQCLRCQYGRDPQACRSHFQPNQLEEFQRLAHLLFLEDEKYDEAKELYQLCHDALSHDRIQEKADLWHAMGAVELTRLQFIEAQRHWRDGAKYVITHSGIALQLEKQRTYGYWDPLPSIAEELSRKKAAGYESLSPRRLFVTCNMVPPKICRQLIEWAEEFGSKAGWTTERHYAVPTNDVPIHHVPKILKWFQGWMNSDVQALLREQFQAPQHRRFYVHDAFLVRYSAAAKSRFLPLHYDESTHSMVLELNDNFEGGGTYFYNVDRTITPSATGSLVSFRGNQLLHGGNVVTKGVRYILAVFMYLDNDSCYSSTEETTTSSSFKRQKMLGKDESAGGFSFGFF